MSRGTPKRQGKKDGVICDDASKREGEGGGRGIFGGGKEEMHAPTLFQSLLKLALPAPEEEGGRVGDWGIVNT